MNVNDALALARSIASAIDQTGLGQEDRGDGLAPSGVAKDAQRLIAELSTLPAAPSAAAIRWLRSPCPLLRMWAPQAARRGRADMARAYSAIVGVRMAVAT